MSSNWKLGLAFSLLTALSWGLLPLALKEVLAVMDPITITWFRFSLSAVMALAWFGFRSGPALRRLLSGASLPWTVLAVFGLTGNYVLYIWGLHFTNPGAAQTLIQFAPLLLLVSSVVYLGEKFQRVQWMGVLGFTVGMFLFFHRRLTSLVPTDTDYLLGAVSLFFAAVIWTGYGLAQKRLTGEHHAKDILLIICLGGSLLLWPVAEPMQVLALNAVELALLLFCGLNTIVAYGAFGLAMTHWEASRVSAVIPLAPLLTLFFTWLFNTALDAGIAAEPLGWLGWVGALLVVGGSALAALPRAVASDQDAADSATNLRR